MIDDYSPSHLYVVLAATAVVGVLSLLTQVRREKRSSWPTWLLIPLALWFAFVLGAESKPPTGFHPAYLTVSVLVIGRWAMALLLRERDRGWVYYILILGGVALIEPASGWLSTWSSR
jgi:ABC-type Co2+ transport system permease subunit